MTEENDKKDMDAWDPWRRRSSMFDSFFDFDEIDREFERMRKYMDALMHEAVSQSHGQGEVPSPQNPQNQQTPDQPLRGDEKRYVYGFTMNVGPDGRPVIREFGNTRPTFQSPELKGVREPIIDMNQTEKSIAITAELPGVEKEDVDLVVNDDSVIIRTKNTPLQFYKAIELPVPVIPEEAAATCKNGILDIQIPKRGKEEKAGHNVKIE